MTKKSKRDELFDLADNSVDTILNMSDEERISISFNYGLE